MNLPEALPVESVSPSRLKDLTECQLRVAFKQHAAKSADKSDAQIIGDSLHAAMAAFAAAREFERDDALALVEARFSAELKERAAGREVRGGRPAAARLKKLAVRIIELLDEAGAGATTLSEMYLEARDGGVHGIVDLIIDSDLLHAIVDYKTGPATDEAGEVVDHYATQVQLYAVLEQERSGRWPSRGVLLRFGGPPVSVDIDPARCEETASRGEEALAAYNALAGTVPPASPSESACTFCSFGPCCPAFWEAISPDWKGRGAIRGRVAWVEISAGGGGTVGLDEARGSLEGTVVVRRLDPHLLFGVALPVGAELAVCGVHADTDGRLVADRSARVGVSGPAE
jgi:CRISPR/Cas system-associated exonuclease Cas4 (RecB family)